MVYLIDITNDYIDFIKNLLLSFLPSWIAIPITILFFILHMPFFILSIFYLWRSVTEGWLHQNYPKIADIIYYILIGSFILFILFLWTLDSDYNPTPAHRYIDIE